MTAADVLAAVRREYAALSETEARLVALSRIEGQPLDPEQPDDAAVLLRSEVLVTGGMPGSQALAQARKELLVYCEQCERGKRFVTKPELPGVAFPTCAHGVVHVETSLDHFLGEK